MCDITSKSEGPYPTQKSGGPDARTPKITPLTPLLPCHIVSTPTSKLSQHI